MHILKIKNIVKLSYHCLYTNKSRGAAYAICSLKYSVPKYIPKVYHNGFNYDYHFILKELAEEFGGQFSCLREETAKKHNLFVSNRKGSDKNW